MSRPMRFHPRARTAFCQLLALAGFVFFVAILPHSPPQESEPDRKQSASGAAALVGASMQKKKPQPEEETTRKEPQETTEKARRKPRSPEQFRPTTRRSEDSSTLPEQPMATTGRPEDRQEIALPPKDLPLSYLTKFQNMEDFHSFLDEVQAEVDPEARTMSLIRIEGLPRSTEKLRRLMESYHMRPFLFNPGRFNYLIKEDLELLKSQSAIKGYIARVGRYIRADGANRAYEEIKSGFVEKALNQEDLREILGAGEFQDMELGLASPQLTAFLHRVEKDTVRQVSELTGRPVSREEIARIDCRYKTVNGAVVLVPWRAYLGTGSARNPIDIWKDASITDAPRT